MYIILYAYMADSSKLTINCDMMQCILLMDHLDEHATFIYIYIYIYIYIIVCSRPHITFMCSTFGGLDATMLKTLPNILIVHLTVGSESYIYIYRYIYIYIT